MATVIIKKGWHKATDKIAMSYAQIKLIENLMTKENCPEWPFSSNSNAMRSLDKIDASTIIDALKSGDVIVFE